MAAPYNLSSSLHVKTESSPSPDLIPPNNNNPGFPTTSTSPDHASFHNGNNSNTPSTPAFRFGLDGHNSPHGSMSWQDSDKNAPDMGLTSMSFMDEFDESSELIDLSSAVAGSSNDASGNADKQVRRRSSKACDQCRKSKCKCERTNSGDPCRNCVLLGTPCTFLGPSKKRGPPKGYIDAIEARLHQSEALLGIMLASEDTRATTLFRDLAQDPLANEIIRRVDASSYGVNGRKQTGEKSQTKHPKTAETDFTAVHPSNEWQDQVLRMLRKTAGSVSHAAGKESSSNSADQMDADSPARRQRRRLDSSVYPSLATKESIGSNPTLVSPIENSRRSTPNSSYLGIAGASQHSSACDSESDEEVRQAVGQLSLNEDEEVRYHGKASGLHLLGAQDRRDSHNVGGLWRFPQTRVWPPLPNSPPSANKLADDFATVRLPPLVLQQRLLDAYFSYVHPYLPLVHKQSFLDLFNASASNNSDSPGGDDSFSESSSSPFQRKRRRIPTILLLAIFSVAARYVEEPPVRTEGSGIWTAGDDYLYSADKVLSKCYAQSSPSTCQALLVMGYREVGIGAMAHAWTYIGMAVRMAQDLGLHRRAEGWIRADMGGQLFEQNELNERRRVWYACVVMDKYVSNYIGRPLSISERDFDTLLPPDDDPEEYESTPTMTRHGSTQKPSRMMSCFNCSARLAGIISMIIQALYSVRPAGSRHDESRLLESVLDRWYLELPPHLRHDSATQDHSPSSPQVLVLHMTYWCAVLLLHRPFIQQGAKQKLSDTGEDHEKHYSLCTNAANRITSIASTYKDLYGMSTSSIFPLYYVFTAGVMHTWTLSIYPDDTQARLGIAKCLDVLYDMEVLWPSASRQMELLRGAKSASSQDIISMVPNFRDDQRKRTASQAFTARSLHDMASVQRHDLANQSLSRNYYPSPSPFGLDRPLGGMAQAPPIPSYYPPVDRWQQMDQGNSLPFAGSNLTTSAVLPQMYSTGMGDDDRAAILPHRLSRSSSQPQLNPAFNAAGRYPPYWNEDFSTFDSLGFGLEDPAAAPSSSSGGPMQYYGNRFPM